MPMTRMRAGSETRLSKYLAYGLSFSLLGATCGSAQTTADLQTRTAQQTGPQSPAAQPSGSAVTPPGTAPQQAAPSQQSTMPTPTIPADPTEPKQSAHPLTQSPAPAPPAPVGTAVAPVVRADGTPASRPAGAAIAPSRQARKHSLALRVGLIVGAAVAIGVVTAASLSSSSRPH